MPQRDEAPELLATASVMMRCLYCMLHEIPTHASHITYDSYDIQISEMRTAQRLHRMVLVFRASTPVALQQLIASISLSSPVATHDYATPEFTSCTALALERSLFALLLGKYTIFESIDSIRFNAFTVFVASRSNLSMHPTGRLHILSQLQSLHQSILIYWIYTHKGAEFNLDVSLSSSIRSFAVSMTRICAELRQVTLTKCLAEKMHN